MGSLPLNWVGAGLMALALGLFIAEMQVPGTGILAGLGAVAFVLGGLLLFGGVSAPEIAAPSSRVSLWVLGSVSAILFAMLAWLLRLAWLARTTSYEGLTRRVAGEIGEVASNIDPHGTVRVGSELWSAQSASGEVIAAGERVIVLDIKGLTVHVDRVPPELS